MSIKVLEYIHSLNDGGAETLVKDYATMMDKECFDVTVVITRERGITANIERLRSAGVKIRTIYPAWNVFIKLWHETIGRWWYVPHQLKRIIREEKADVIHIHLDMLKYISKISDELTDINLFYTSHTVPQRTFAKYKTAEKKAAKLLIKKNNLRLVALHGEMAKELNEMFDVYNTAVIRNGIDYSKFKNLSITKSEKRKEINIPENAFVVGHVGRFHPVKNHGFLIEVFREIAKRKPNAHLLMVGAGNTKEIDNKLRNYGLKDQYSVLSHRKDVNEILRAMDVFVFPSICEGLGIALIEAQVSGLKCVASDTIPEEAFKTEKAIALPLGDAKRWAEVILDENAKGTPHGNLDDYDMNKEIKRLEKLYMGTLDD